MSSFGNGDLLGDRLAAYHDLGGGVVVTMFAIVFGSQSESLKGNCFSACAHIPLNSLSHQES
jgi:hypothetical protein